MKDHRQKTYLLVAVPAILMLVFGSTSLVAAEDGTPLSRSRYTPFGEVEETQVWKEEPADSGTYAWVTLDPTEPITQTDTLYQGDTLERDLGIYFTADGRYYDPWLGKYLQPDPIGGPPLIPQAADRYQYAGNSPTGVSYAGGGTPGWAFVGGVAIELGQEGASRAIKRLLPSFATQWKVMKPTGYALVSLQARKQMIQRLAPSFLDDLSVTSRELPELAFGSGRFRRFLAGFFTDRYDTLSLSGRMLVSDLPSLSLAEAAHLNLHVERELTEEVFESSIGTFANKWIIKGLVGEVAVPFGLDAGFQLLQDWGNPYLTPGQKWERAAWAGGFGVLAGGVGLLIGGPLGTGVGIALEVLLWPKIEPVVHRERGLNEQMHLQPLRVP
jgi:RHS repeat-associated protein